LLLVRGARQRRDDLEMAPLHGRPFIIRSREWKFPAKKTIYYNLVRVDARMIREGRECLPKPLEGYARGPFALGIVKSERNGPIYWPGQNEPSRLFYDEDSGIEVQRSSGRGRISPTQCEDDDESRD